MEFPASSLIHSSSLSGIVAPIAPGLWPLLSIILFAVGGLFATWFFLIILQKDKSRSVPWQTELTVAAGASVFLGLASLFVLLSVGVYV
jgi:hypothetical protein